MFNPRRRCTVYVDDQPVKTNQEVTPYDLMRATGYDPSTRSLATENRNGGMTILPRQKPIRVVSGQPFETSLTAEGGR